MKRSDAPFLAVFCAVALASPWANVAAQTGLANVRAAAPASVVVGDRKAPSTLDTAVSPPLPDLGSAPGTKRLRGSSADLLGSYVQLEMPRDLGDGQYSRPKLRFGMQSESLKSWATAAGLQPERCTLPTLRARSSASSGEINGSVMLLARCTFY